MEYTTDKSFAGSSDELGEVLKFREPTEEELELVKQKFEQDGLKIDDK